MTRTAVPFASEREASLAARDLNVPSEVYAFEERAELSAAGLAFLDTPGWQRTRERLVGDGNAPLAPATSPSDLALLFRYMADPEEFAAMSDDARRAYLHCAGEIEALVRRTAVRPAAAEAAPVLRSVDRPAA
jgi:hypothetical protein